MIDLTDEWNGAVKRPLPWYVRIYYICPM